MWGTIRPLSSWSWWTTLDCEMPRSPDTLWMLLTGFTMIVKGTSNTGLWNTELAWYSPSATRQICRGREGDESRWTVRCGARLILFDCYLPDLLRSWRWRIALDYEMLSSPDTFQVLLARFIEVVKVTNHNRLWYAQLAW